MSIMQMLLGAGGGDTGLPVEDVFDIKLYLGNTPVGQTINNGMNLDTSLSGGSPGGMVLIKVRDYLYGGNYSVWDTDRGPGYFLILNGSGKEEDTSGWTGDWDLYQFLTNGFNLGTNNSWTNGSGYNHVAWTFMKSSKFFDICTWSGENDSTDQTIPHNLGCEPGMIIAKSRSSNTTDWYVYHTSLGNQDYIRMNSDAASNGDTGADQWAPTGTNFKAADALNLNDGDDYIAYLFAKDEANIKCGKYIGTGEAGNSVTVGFKPQFLLIKRAIGGTSNWVFLDTARGINSSEDGLDKELWCPSAAKETGYDNYVTLTDDGFDVEMSSPGWDAYNKLGDEFIYVAIKEED